MVGDDGLPFGSLSLWLLSVGSMAARESGDRAWFVAQIVKRMETLGFAAWDEVRCELAIMHLL